VRFSNGHARSSSRTYEWLARLAETRRDEVTES
jgi:hypothetical protein